jgi:hypothetical protein
MKAIRARTLGALTAMLVLALVAFFDASRVPPAEAPVLAAPTASPYGSKGYSFDTYGNNYSGLVIGPRCEYQTVAPTLTDGQVSILQCDQNGNMLTVGGFAGTLQTGTAQFGALNDALPQRSGAALQSPCSIPCSFATTALHTIYYVDNDGPAMITTQTVTVYDGTAAAGIIILYTQNMGNTQERVWGPTGRHLSNGFVTVVLAGSVLPATANIEVGGR